MVARLLRAAALTILLLLAGCDLFRFTPYPEYIAGLETMRDVSVEIETALLDETRARYDLWVVEITPGVRRLLLLVAPLVSEGEDEKPATLLVYDEVGALQGVVEQPDPLSYLSRPFVLAADGSLLVGVVALDPVSLGVNTVLGPHGLTGYGGSAGGFTYLFSQPAGETLSFTLAYRTYDAAWTVVDIGTVDIVPPERIPVPDPTAPATTEPGFRLLTMRVLDTGIGIFVFSEPAQNRLHLTTADLSDVVSGAVDAIMPSGEGVLVDFPLNTFLYPSNDSFLVRSASGTFTRYTWEGFQLETVGSERGTGRVYAVDTLGQWIYRLDPVDRTLAVIRAWW